MVYNIVTFQPPKVFCSSSDGVAHENDASMRMTSRYFGGPFISRTGAKHLSCPR